jgi:predicted amidohydrolase
MQDSIRIGLFQLDTEWNNCLLNQLKIKNLISGLSRLPELLILPEMYATGYSVNPEVFNTDEINLQPAWQLSVSKEFQIGIMGSSVVYENGQFFNRLIYTLPDGTIEFYDKRHLFRMGEENLHYSEGNERKLFDFRGIKIMPQICYDLRFPVWSRNNKGYHLLIYSANWPASRQNVWNTLLPARAIENQCYTIGVNRVGSDNNSIRFEGGSAVYNAKGEALVKLDAGEEYTEIELSLKELLDFRESFPAYLDADIFEIKNREILAPGL